MKKLIIHLLSFLILSACVRPAGTPTPISAPTNPLATYIETPTAIILQPTHTSVSDEGGGGEATATPTDTPEATETGQPTPFIIRPTITPTIPPPGTEPPDTTEELPTAGPTNKPEAFQLPSYPPFDPIGTFGTPRFTEDFEDNTAWKDYYGNMGNEKIALVIKDGQMQVTGKYSYFRTWWFGGFDLTDFYIEMDVNTGTCSDDDTYGLILRGEPSDHGYIVGFNCGGEVAAWRVDAVNPYTEIEILGYTKTDLIRKGSNRPNILGVMMKGDEITIYANRYEFTTIYDDTYDWGQYGVFVMAGPKDNYTYTTSQIRIWDVEP